MSTPPPDDALAASYARGGFGQSLAWGSRPALDSATSFMGYEMGAVPRMSTPRTN